MTTILPIIYELISVGNLTAFFTGWMLCNYRGHFFGGKSIENDYEEEKDCDTEEKTKIKFTTKEKEMLRKIRLKKPTQKICSRSFGINYFLPSQSSEKYVILGDVDDQQKEYNRCKLTKSEKKFIRYTLTLKFKDRKYKDVREALGKNGFTVFVESRQKENGFSEKYPFYYDPTVVNLRLENVGIRGLYDTMPCGLENMKVVEVSGPQYEDDYDFRALRRAKEKEKKSDIPAR